jgi:crotonobetainyl-CoA:carnitine CoA-transferase CaiB-like acyl-CoA transferase
MLPLQGIRIVSFNHYLAGPLAAQMLADMGADVIAIEPIEGAWHRGWGGGNHTVDGQSLLFLAANRNKKSLALNLKDPQGRAVAKKLLATADVLMENFRPGVMAKMGLDYEELRQELPKLIYAAVSGYGQDGPYEKRPGQDLLIQALSGLATITGNTQDKARAIGVSVVDHHGATLFAIGVLGALVKRGRDGLGSRVDVDLLSAGLNLQAESLTCYLNSPKPETINPPPYIAGWYYSAPYGIYPTRDAHMAISLAPVDRLAGLLDLPDLAGMTAEDAYVRKEEIGSKIAAVLKTRDRQEWISVFTEADIWHAPVNDYEAVVADPQIRHNGTIATIEGATGAPVTLVRHPIRYDGATPEIRLAPQPLGAQTREILQEIGYTGAEIGRLIEDRVARGADVPVVV